MANSNSIALNQTLADRIDQYQTALANIHEAYTILRAVDIYCLTDPQTQGEPEMIFSDEPEPDETPCPRCGKYEVMYQQCNECEDGIINDLYEEDPLWYDPGAWKFCRNCNGTGAHRWCRNCGWDLVWNVFLSQSYKPVKEFALKRPFEFILLQSRFVESKTKTG